MKRSGCLSLLAWISCSTVQLPPQKLSPLEAITPAASLPPLKITLRQTINDTGNAALSPDGETLAVTGPDDHFVRLYQVSTGELLASFAPDKDSVPYAYFSADSSKLFTVERRLINDAQQFTVKTWVVSTQQLLSSLALPEGNVSISERGQVLLTEDDYSYIKKEMPSSLWNSQTGTHKEILEKGCLRFVEDETLLMSCAEAHAEDSFLLLDAATGDTRLEIKQPRDGISEYSFSDDGEAVLLTSGDELSCRCSDPGWHTSYISLWDLKQKTSHLKRTDWESATLHPSGRQVAAIEKMLRVPLEGHPRALVWDLEQNKERFVLPDEDIRRLSYTGDGSVLLTEQAGGTVKLWDSQTGAPIADISGHPRSSYTVLSKDRRIVFTQNYQTIRAWDAMTGKELARFDNIPWALPFSVNTTKEGHFIVTGESRLYLWQVVQ